MLLRSLTKHVKDQNWFAVFIDFFIVVAGILLAFQITNWSEAKSDRANERKYLTRLSIDLAETMKRNESQEKRNVQMIDELNLTLKALDACALPAEYETAFTSGLFYLGRYNLPEMVSVSFDEMKTTGKFQLIRDVKLSEKITAFYESFERTSLIDKQLNDRVIPKLNYVRKHIRFNHLEDIDRDGMDINFLDIDFESSCRDREFKNSIGAVRETLLAINRLTRSTIKASSTLKSSIDEAL